MRLAEQNFNSRRRIHKIKSLAADSVVNILLFSKKSGRVILIFYRYLNRIMKLVTNGFVLQYKPTRM